MAQPSQKQCHSITQRGMLWHSLAPVPGRRSPRDNVLAFMLAARALIHCPYCYDLGADVTEDLTICAGSSESSATCCGHVEADC